MATVSLPISNLISVQVSLTQQAAQSQNISSLLILGSSGVIDTVSRMRVYSDIEEVAEDFGTSAPEYLAAVLWFEQLPQPTQLYIGEWAKTATSGQLIGGLLTAAQQALTIWNPITNGSLNITIDGGSVQHITGLSFAAAGNMNAVAAVIGGVLTGATIVWNAIFQRFQITSDTTGASSSVSFASTEGTGTDISGLLQLTNTTPATAYQAPGVAAETAISAVELFDNKFGQLWFAITVIGAVDADTEAIASYIEAANTIHVQGVTTQETAVLTPGDTTDIAYILQQLGYNRTFVQYSSTNPYAVVSMLARILTTNWAGQNTAITLMYKQEPGIVPEVLNQTQMAALLAKNCNVFVSYNILQASGANIAILQPGICPSGQFIDSVIGAFVMAIQVQTAVFNALYTTPTKVPQTDPGTNVLIAAIAQVMAQFVADGLLAPGIWNAQGVGQQQQGQVIAKGYYIYAPSVNTQTEAQRATRISVPIQILAKLAGAVHSAQVQLIVNP